MTLEEKWMVKYNEVMEFIENEHRNPLKYVDEEREFVNWIKHQRKVMNAGKLKEDRVELFNELLDLAEEYRRVNQYV